MKRINWKVVLSNLAEAKQELAAIERKIKENDLSEVELQVFIEHAYHHLNFAWNARYCKMSKYIKMTARDFNRWSKFPVSLSGYLVKK